MNLYLMLTRGKGSSDPYGFGAAFPEDPADPGNPPAAALGQVGFMSVMFDVLLLKVAATDVTPA